MLIRDGNLLDVLIKNRSVVWASPEINTFVVGGHPAPDGASPTQPYKCSQNVKVKVNVNTNAVLASPR